jgi:creatinine amidohydrolase
VSVAMAIAQDINALIAPHVPYGLTDILGQYPGSLYIPPDVFRSYLRAVLVGLVNNRFRDIVILNGHGPQVGILRELATEISAISRKNAGCELGGSWRTASLVNYSGNTAGPRLTRRLPWCKRPTQSRFTGFFSPASTWRPRFPRDGWSATPFPSTVIQYTQGLGLPKDRGQAKADEYSQKVIAKASALVQNTLQKWAMAGFK